MQRKNHPDSVEGKLDLIIDILERMDQRERWRMRGAYIRSAIHVAYIVILALGLWYFYAHWDEILQQIAAAAAQQAAVMTQGGVDSLKNINLKDLMKQFAP